MNTYIINSWIGIAVAAMCFLATSCVAKPVMSASRPMRPCTYTKVSLLPLIDLTPSRKAEIIDFLMNYGQKCTKELATELTNEAYTLYYEVLEEKLHQGMVLKDFAENQRLAEWARTPSLTDDEIWDILGQRSDEEIWDQVAKIMNGDMPIKHTLPNEDMTMEDFSSKVLHDMTNDQILEALQQIPPNEVEGSDDPEFIERFNDEFGPPVRDVKTR